MKHVVEPDEARFRLLVENIGDVLWFMELGPKRYSYVSPAFETIWGRKLAEVTKNPRVWEDAIHPDDRKGVKRALRQWLTGDKTTYEAHYRVLSPTGEVRWLADRGIILGRKNGRPYAVGGIARDVTEIEAREALRKHLGAVVENSDDAIITLDLHGVIQTWNAGAQRIFQYSAAEAIGRPVSFLRPPQAADDEAVFRRLIRQGKRIKHYETVRQRKDGSVIDISLSISPLLDSSGRITGFSKISRDITASKQAELTIKRLNTELEERVRLRTTELMSQIEARRQLEEEILHISEREQRRIGQDLHDDLGQQLAGAWMMADVLKRKLGADKSPHLSEAARLESLLERAMAHTRTLARGLHPVAPEQGGFTKALELLAEQSRALFGIHCVFSCKDRVVQLEDFAMTPLYRIAQEAVTNAVKHGKATRVLISLTSSSLAVRDDGCGFKKDGLGSEGLGMRIMRYRAEMIGADLKVGNRRCGGAEVVCRFGQDHKAFPTHGRTKA
ncbi:MAG: PAS domain S-box protein [Verrucomicrobiaceae bacterium]|nr:PAS domain S-box protein [Verrucomicrobiaceae bacterium]